VGIEINGSHLRPVSSGRVTGVCTPIRVGFGIHFWRVAIFDEAGEQCCESRLTTKILRTGSGAG
jgi:1,4-dihydroxy-2-naphthoyl-CoA hydrolase